MIRLQIRLFPDRFLSAAFLLALAPLSARADIIDLTSKGSSGTSQGAIFMQTDPQPTGTGVINPFVRIQMTGTERGYNTDARPVEFDTKDENQWTHSLNLYTLTPETIQGTSYYKFLLDVNEEGNQSGRLLSLNDVRLYLGNSPELTGWNDGFGSNSFKIYDLDGGSGGDTTIELDYKLNHGSGSGDMFAYIPTSLFEGYDSTYQWVYLYSAFGNPNQSDAGFEEWAAYTGPYNPPPVKPVPAPPAVLLVAIAVGCGAIRRGIVRRSSNS